jgi:benzoyl-CoA-dihydrodiol lyase
MAWGDVIDFERRPESYRHWRLETNGPVAMVKLSVDPTGGLGDAELKLNSYDLSVDIELADIVQRLRFEHPEVRAVVITGGLDKVFCAGANIQMLASATHHHKVNFCKFTNETRAAIEDATAHSGQVYLAALNGTAAGGGYELALACAEIILVDDRSSTVSLPEVALLGVLPGTGGLTRLVDKRCVRRDLADLFSTRAEGVKAEQALQWGLVDSASPRSRFAEHVAERAAARAAESDRPTEAEPIWLDALDRKVQGNTISYRHVTVEIERQLRSAAITLGAAEAGEMWFLTAARELDDAILHLRFNDPEIGTWVLRTEGEARSVIDADTTLGGVDWGTREVRLLWKRTLKRLDLSAATLVALVEPGSCFAGTWAELALAADRTYVLEDPEADCPATITLTEANDGWYPMSNGLTRLQSRFWGRPDELETARRTFGQPLEAKTALSAGLATAVYDDIDWVDEVRLVLEERASFSPDALTGMEANLRFVGPETMETKIFGRLTAWQNWIFQRPNASGPAGALRRYGSGSRPEYDHGRV